MNDPFARAIADADRLLQLAQIRKELDQVRNTIATGREVIKTETARQAATQPSSEMASVAHQINRRKDPRT